MSEQKTAKDDQRYREQPDTCANCGHFQSDMVDDSYTDWMGNPVEFFRETNLRCSIGGFAVKKTATCDLHVLKEQQ